MGNTSLKRFGISLVLFFLVAAGLALALRQDRATPAVETPRVAPEKGPREVWRCHACAMIQGKNWATCKTVTGRGTEKATRDLVTKRVCAAAEASSVGCRLTQIKCRQLSEEAVKGRPTVKVHQVSGE